ncbi:hypothetical protein [Streptomyces chrestomyceticus]|uniref:hypothetical protein n=1 Tax=Streptomyces chrestomyceticus TaxID=68185 RepID=UPI00340F9C88
MQEDQPSATRRSEARRDARDHERLPQVSEAHLTWFLVALMSRRLTSKSPRAH